jgi:flagellar hook-associated protein 1 FlgK
LLDQQEAALQSLSSQISVNVLPQPNGQVLVSSGGTILLDQSGAQTLSLTGGTVGNPPQITAGHAGAALNAGPGDGNIGGNIQSWNSGTQALQALNARAAIFSAAINQSQAQGLTVNGTSGAALFTTPTPNVTAGAGNFGTAQLTAQLANAGQLPSTSGPFLVSYSAGAGWSATDQANQQSYALGSGPNLAFAGLAVSVAGTPTSGDAFVVNPAPGAAAGLNVAATNANAIAAADPYVVTPGALQNDGSVLNGNAGTLTAGADVVTSSPASGAASVPAAYYGQSLQITFTSATAYTVAAAGNPGTVIASGSLNGKTGTLAVAYPAGLAQGQYWQVPFSGTASAGDVLTVQPGGSASGSNAARMAALWTAPGTTVDGTLQQSVVGLGTQLGANANQAQQLSSATAAQVTTATTNLQGISGVSLDQQAVVLTSYSQAYQAAAQVISTAHTMFESLLQAI